MSKNIYGMNMTINELIKKHFPKKVRFSSRISYIGEDEDEKLKPLLRKYLNKKEEYVEEEKDELIKSIDCISFVYKEEEKYPDSEEEEEELKKALELSIMTNNVDIHRRKLNLPTLGRSDIIRSGFVDVD